MKIPESRNSIYQWVFLIGPCSVITGGVIFHRGYQEGYATYFLIASYLVPILSALTTKKLFIHILKSILGIVTISVLTEVFWGYMDKPWFSPPETYTCDGPCYGWFSFENFPPTINILKNGVYLILATIILKLIISRAIKRD